MKPYSLLLVGFAIAGAACATKPEITPDQQLKDVQAQEAYSEKYMTRIYSGKSKQEVLDAAEKILTLSDGDDVSFSHGVNGFTADRQWHWFGKGIDRWTVEATPESKNNIKLVLHETTIRTISNQPATYVYGIGVMYTGPATTSYVPTGNDKRAIYDLFLRRMDYMLGLTKTWPTCKAFEAEMATNKELEGNIKALCDVLAKDDLPIELQPKN